MAQLTKLAAILNGLLQNVDLTTNTLVVSSVKYGGTAGTELTKVILDNLVALQNGTDFSSGTNAHTHDGRYYTETELGSATSSSGSDLIGDDNTYTYFTPAATTVKAALQAIDGALANVADEKVKVSAADTTKGYLEDKLLASGAITVTKNNTGANENLTVSITQSSLDHGSIGGLGDDDHTQYHNDARGDARYYQKSEFVTTSTAGAPIKLDGSGKIATAQLPFSVMTYEGMWNASTNTPALADGTGDAGMYYIVSTSGSQNLGSGSISFNAGDSVIYDGAVWQKLDMTDAVVSVFGRIGMVTAESGDYTASQITNVPAGGIEATTVQAALDELDLEKFNSADFDSTFDTRLATKNTTDIAEGTNLYFTDERAQDALAAALITSDTITFNYDDNANTISADVLAAPLLKKPMIAGESMSANTSYLVRWAVSGETAGRVYKATNANAGVDNKFWAIGLALKTSAVSAGDTVDVVALGTHTLGSADTAFSGSDIGKAVWLGADGAFLVEAPLDSGTAAFKVGIVETTTKIWLGDKQITGIN